MPLNSSNPTFFVSKKSLKALFCALLMTTGGIQALSLQQTFSYIIGAPSLVKYLCKTALNNKSYKKDEDKKYDLDLEDLSSKIKNQIKLFGVSTSEHQCSNKCTPEICNWSRFAQKNDLKQPNDENYPCNFWDNYESYIKQLKEKTGITAMRFSIERALVETAEGQFDQKALNHYADVFKCYIENDITPVVCFHHYTDPYWFAKKGGFENEENSASFVNYCTKVYEAIMEKVFQDATIRNKFIFMCCQGRAPLWLTFNSPEGVAFKGYRQMEGPPADPKKKGLSWVLRVLKNMCESHVQVYKSINKTHKEKFSSLPKPTISLMKNITQLDTANKTWMHTLCRPLTNFICTIGNDIQNECMYNFFTTGEFKTNTPGFIETHKNPDAPKSLDCICINYYSNQKMHLTGRVPETNEEYKTDNTNYRMYPHGLYRAIAEISDRIAKPVGAIKNKDGKPLPIYITENGIATKDDKKRNYFYQQYLGALVQAIKDDYPVRGYLTWTAFDNYEWPKTNTSNKNQSDNRVYGLCTVSKDGKTLTPKKGAQFFIDFAKTIRAHSYSRSLALSNVLKKTTSKTL